MPTEQGFQQHARLTNKVHIILYSELGSIPQLKESLSLFHFPHSIIWTAGSQFPPVLFPWAQVSHVVAWAKLYGNFVIYSCKVEVLICSHDVQSAPGIDSISISARQQDMVKVILTPAVKFTYLAREDPQTWKCDATSQHFSRSVPEQKNGSTASGEKQCILALF